ncbi:hypothetical protein Gotri_005393 [Gossypium trilobum]|uniref:Uncharacterized protein n=1 Tax=Gossypium trilobum TaxID=34281 RepID=A0A7J9EWD3_9ROSI|nr:hypothetical protein [Gossypium trilobum]
MKTLNGGMIPDEILYRYGDFEWVHLLRIWRAIGYAPLFVLRRIGRDSLYQQYNGWFNVSFVQRDRKVRLRKEEFRAREKDRKVRRGKDSEENIRADQWEKKFQDARVREDALKIDLLESRNGKVGLRAHVAELERSLHQHRSRNSMVKLKASLTKIEKLKGTIEELEAALDRDHIIGEALTQVQEVAEHLQTLAVQADMLGLRYESESNWGQELDGFLKNSRL